MSKSITFFRNRQQDAGHTYELEIEDSTRPYRIVVYSRTALDEALARSPRQLRGGSITEEADKITQALLRAEGGVIALTYEENRERTLVVIPVPSEGKPAFGSFGLLLPGHPSLRLEPLAEKGIRFPAGSHALVPVDKEAEEYLRGFQDYLGYLPPDLGSLVLHSIRDPSLDLRVGRLEAMALRGTGGSGTAPTGRAGVAGSPSQGWLKRSVPVWAAAATLLSLVLAVMSMLLHLDRQSAEGPVEITGMGLFRDSDSREETPEESILAVAEAVRGYRGEDSDPLVKLNALGHFSMVNDASSTKAVLARKSVAGKEDKEKVRLVQGLMKLEALRLKPADTTRLWEEADTRTALKDFCRKNKLDERPETRTFLAALSCEGFGAPALPESMEGESPPLRFADEDQTCERDFPRDKAAPGLQRLLDFVRNYKPQDPR